MGRLVRSALTHAGRLVGTALAVTLAVGLVSGTFMLTDTVSAAFHRAAAQPNGTADIVVRATAGFTGQATSLPEREPLPESLMAKVAAVPGIQALWGTIQGYAEMVDKAGKAIAPNGLPPMGGGWAPGDTLAAGRAPRPGEVAIDVSTANRYHFHLGDKVKIVFQGSAQNFTVAGVLRRTADLVASTKAIFDAETAKQVLGQKGQVDTIAVRVQAGANRTRAAVAHQRHPAHPLRGGHVGSGGGGNGAVVDQVVGLPPGRAHAAGSRGAAGRRTAHLQYLLDPGGAADPGAGPASGPRGQPNPAAPAGPGRGGRGGPGRVHRRHRLGLRGGPRPAGAGPGGGTGHARLIGGVPGHQRRWPAWRAAWS